MDWRNELAKLESSYASVIQGDYPKSPKGRNPPSSSTYRQNFDFNYKKWSDQGIIHFPPKATLQHLNPISIELFETKADKMNIPGAIEFCKEIEFLESYVRSIYERAVNNRNKAIEVELFLIQRPPYLDEEEEGEFLLSHNKKIASLGADQQQLTDEINGILNRSMLELESSDWNASGSAVAAHLDALRKSGSQLRNELMASDVLIQAVTTRLAELKLTPVESFCPMDGIRPDWSEVDKVRTKQTLSGHSRNFVSFMSAKDLPVNKSVFAFLQQPSLYNNELVISNYSFAVGELQSILDFFIIASHPLVMGRCVRKTLATSAKGSLADAASRKLLHSFQSLVILSCELSDRDCNSIALRLPIFSRLHTLCLRANSITCLGATSIATALWGNPMNIQSLSLDDNDIGVEGAIALSRVLKRCRNLTSFSISGNPIGDCGLYFIMKSCMSRFRKARSLLPRPSELVGSEYEFLSSDDGEDDSADEGDEGSDAEDHVDVASAATTPTVNTLLSISSRSIGSKDKPRTKRRTDAFSKGPQVVDEDDVDDFSVSDSSVYSAGSHILRKPPNFRAALLQQTALDLYGSPKHSEWRRRFTSIKYKLLAVICFRKLLFRGLRLHSMDFSGCDISNESCKIFRHSILDNNNIVELCVSSNRGINDQGAEELCELLRNNRLASLKVQACSLSDAGIQSLSIAASRSTFLSTLDVSSNQAGPTGINWIGASSNVFTVDDLSLAAGYHKSIPSGSQGDEAGGGQSSEEWRLWQGAEAVAAEVADYWDEFYDDDNDFEGEEDDEDEDSREDLL